MLIIQSHFAPQNIAPNHRANDVIVLEGKPQTLTARFMYGPLDVITLSGEKVFHWLLVLLSLIGYLYYYLSLVACIAFSLVTCVAVSHWSELNNF